MGIIKKLNLKTKYLVCLQDIREELHPQLSLQFPLSPLERMCWSDIEWKSKQEIREAPNDPWQSFPTDISYKYSDYDSFIILSQHLDAW